MRTLLAFVGLFISLLFPTFLSAQTGLNLPFLPQQLDAQWHQPAWMLCDSTTSARLGGGLTLRGGVYPLTTGQLLSLPSFIDEATKDDLVGSLGNDNRIDISQTITSGINAQVGPLTLGLGFRQRVSTYLSTQSPQTLGLVLYGNARYADETVSDEGINGHLATYQEYSLAGAYGQGIWQAALRVKVLVGRQFLGGENLSYSLFTEENGAYIDLSGSYRVLETNLSQSPGIGIGADLGVVVRPSEKLTLQAAILDLGQLNWQGSLRENQFSLRYEGVDLGNLIDVDLSDGVSVATTDSLQDLIWVDSVAGSMSMSLPSQAHVGASFALTPQNILLGSVHYGWVPYGLDGALVNVGYQRKFGSVGLLGVNAFLGGQDRYGVGLHGQLSLRMGEIVLGQLYASADNLTGLLLQDSAHGFAAQVGLTLSLVSSD